MCKHSDISCILSQCTMLFSFETSLKLFLVDQGAVLTASWAGCKHAIKNICASLGSQRHNSAWGCGSPQSWGQGGDRIWQLDLALFLGRVERFQTPALICTNLSGGTDLSRSWGSCGSPQNKEKSFPLPCTESQSDSNLH